MKLAQYFTLSFFILLVSCTYTTGEGSGVEKEFALDSFEGVALEGSFDVNIEQGAAQKVVAVGHENIIEKLILKVEDDVLYISLEPGSYFNFDLEVNITVPSLESIALDGSGDILIDTFVGLNDLNVKLDGSGDIKSKGTLEVKGMASISLDGSGDVELRLKANEVNAKLDGSGDIVLEGVAESFKADLEGSGDIKAYSLQAQNCVAKVEGSGTVKLFASKKLKAELEGSGSIRYRGEPSVDADVRGSGNVSADID